MKKKKQKKIIPVDLNNLEEMIELGYRNPLVPRDQSVWTKTASEKKALKRAKKIFKGYQFISEWGYKKHPIPYCDKLIIELVKCPKFLKRKGYSPNHLTFTYECGQSDISEILAKFAIDEYNEKREIIGTKSLVRRYKWNGRYYEPTELPFWYW